MQEDVQSLLRKVTVRPDEGLSQRFPQEMPCRVQVFLRDGRVLTGEKRDYEGFFTRPMPWERLVQKFKRLSARHAQAQLQQEIVQAVASIESIPVSELTKLLARLEKGGTP